MTLYKYLPKKTLVLIYNDNALWFDIHSTFYWQYTSQPFYNEKYNKL